jgi:hypothetical protein
MRRSPSPRLAALALLFPLASLTPACGDDDGPTDTGAETGPAASTSESSPGTTAASSSEDGSTTSADGLDSTGSTAAASSEDDGTTTGPAGDPTYPPPDGGSCPQGTAPVVLPGAQLCAPFCGDEADQCPPAATGDAPAMCTPFAGRGGSGDPCDDSTACPDGETCDAGSCVAVAFFACQLRCGMGETCPDGMECSGIGTCGYP